MLVPRSDLVEGPQPIGVEGNSNKFPHLFLIFQYVE